MSDIDDRCDEAVEVSARCVLSYGHDLDPESDHRAAIVQINDPSSLQNLQGALEQLESAMVSLRKAERRTRWARRIWYALIAFYVFLTIAKVLWW